jgi:hypothetical protein
LAAETTLFAVAAIGLLTVAPSMLMIASPAAMSRAILAFGSKPCFHAAEIVIRLVPGAVLVACASQTLHPRVVAAFGYVLVAVGAGLVILGPTRHRAFAVKSATFTSVFRPAGFASLAFGVFVIYSALGSLLLEA